MRVPPTPYRLPPTARRGFTLTELLVVVIIIAVVTVATIPLLKPALDSRRIREAARLFTSQLAAAQSQAIANGNSVGVSLGKIQIGDPSSAVTFKGGDASMDLYLCETPDPYSGDSTSSTVSVQVIQTGTRPNAVLYPGAPPQNAPIYQGSFLLDMSKDNAWVGLLRKNDIVTFGSSGTKYYILGAVDSFGQPANAVDANGYLQPSSTTTVVRIEPLDDDGFDFDYSVAPAQKFTPHFRHLPPATLAPGGWNTSFQVIRQPIRSVGAPVQLPSGAIVDVYFSGMGSSSKFTDPYNDANPVEIIFDRTGALEFICVGGTHAKVIAPLYFLIGKREKAFNLTASDPADQNWADIDNIWVTINPHTGVASTTEVASDSSGPPTSLVQSRAYAISAQAMGGK